MATRWKVQLGQAIRNRRLELGMTQRQLAEATHHETQTVSRWERGENMPTDLEVVTRALSWTLQDLVTGIEAPNQTVARRLGLVSAADVRAIPPDRLSGIERQLEELRLQLAAHDVEVLKRLDAMLEPARASRTRRPA